MSTGQQALEVVVGAFVDELARAGLGHVCVCPGSRSTPLAIKLAQARGHIKLWMHLDERSAAFFALGLARTLRQPVGLLATSGTAAANFLPAVVEASLARVPLVVLTADRPHELREVGAAQTIDQLRLYGSHARWFFDLPEPELTTEQVRLVRTVAARAVSTARAEPAGPVHLNWPFREPLVPVPVDDDDRPTAWDARPNDAPYVSVETGRLAPSAELVGRLAADLMALPRGVIVCGPQDDPDLPHAVAALA
ncbi:MAG TPA: 2-succinyl-5-enolpyruvyl-6-hydroxy-3-cyclohexene-1-carboxylic-acid synthase, partial [Chloroflexota bacterium]